MITQARYTEYGAIRATIDGTEYFIPDDMANRHRQMIAEWEAESNTIEPYVPPPPPVPQSVSWRQAQLALVEIGKYEEVQGLLAAITDPVEKLKAEIEFNSPTYERSSEFLNFMWSQVQEPKPTLDALFTLAATK